MPLLRQWDKPRFDTIGEVIEFFKQIFEGVQFMHKHNIAHRDCSFPGNILMDGAPLYRIPFHPIRQDRKRDCSGKATHFGLSRQYKAEERPPLERTVRGGDKAPEMVLDACDPFPTDVYYLGNSIQRHFLEGWDIAARKLGFEFMRPLVKDMIQTDPSQRPSMDEVLHSRVVKETEIFGSYYNIPHWLCQISFIVRRVPPIPVPSH
ncbi:kinase-like domain-containing protein [Mycena haematopus]|nr:kinase-like domain-containing protein [Mycena haematopus]